MSPRFYLWALFTLLIGAGSLTGCTGTMPDGTTVAQFLEAASDTAEPSQTATAAPEEPVFELKEISAADPLTAREVFSGVSPAIAFVETPISTGSAVYIEPGYLLTNAHVVWPYLEARIVFPDETAFEKLPVVAWDLMADLALLGPVDHDVQRLTLTQNLDMGIGSQVYLIGYPGEVERFPQPTLVQGIISRVRRWAPLDMDFFQVDASVAGGQSGGALVSEGGDVLGIVSYYFTDAGFGLVPSAAGIVPRLNALTAQEDAAFQERRFLEVLPVYEYDGALRDAATMDMFVLLGTLTADVEMTADGAGTPYFDVYDIFGDGVAESQPQRDGAEQVEAVLAYDAPYWVYLWQVSPYENQYELTSSTPLYPVVDPDDDRTIAVGETVLGAIDIPGDADRVDLELEQGERIVITVESLMIDPFIYLFYEGSTLEESVFDDDSGPQGIFGLNAEIVYEAPESGEYTLIISDATGADVGAYIATLRTAEAGERATELETRNSLTLSPYGRLAQYEGNDADFQLLYPIDWIVPEDLEESCGPGVTLCAFDGSGAGLILVEEDLTGTHLEDADLAEYVDETVEFLADTMPGFELIYREEYTTLQGMDAETITFEGQGGRITVRRLFFVDDDNHAISVAILADTDDFELFEDFVDLLFESFRFWDTENLESDPVWHFDEGNRLGAQEKYTEALAAFDRAIELDADFARAYVPRAHVHAKIEDFDRMLADLDRYVELEPDDPDGYKTRSFWYLVLGRYEPALVDLDRALEIDPEDVQIFNSRAQAQAAMGDSDAALATLEEAAETVDELPANMRDTWAYIHLLRDESEAATSRYEALLAEDYQGVYTLMGAGIARARAGDLDSGLPLIERGYEQVTDVNLVDPQLANLLRWSEEIIGK